MTFHFTYSEQCTKGQLAPHQRSHFDPFDTNECTWCSRRVTLVERWTDPEPPGMIWTDWHLIQEWP